MKWVSGIQYRLDQGRVTLKAWVKARPPDCFAKLARVNANATEDAEVVDLAIEPILDMDMDMDMDMDVDRDTGSTLMLR